MAYKQNSAAGRDKETEHAFKRFSKNIKTNEFPSAVMLFGEEDYLVRWARDSLRKSFLSTGSDTFDYSSFNAQNCTTAEIIMACQSFPLMSDRRVIVADNLKILGGQGGNDVDEDELSEFITELPDTSILILTGKKADARRKAYKFINKNGGVYDFSRLDRKALVSFINKRIKAAKKTASPNVIASVIEMSGYYEKESDYTLDSLSNDLTKLIAYSEDVITIKDVEETLTGNVTKYTFTFLDALCDGRKGEAYSVMNNILSSGGNELALLGAICSQLEVMLCVREMKDDGLSLQQMIQSLEIHEFRVKKAIGLVRRFTADKLKRILIEAYAVEKQLKTGYLDGHLALELFVAAV